MIDSHTRLSGVDADESDGVHFHGHTVKTTYAQLVEVLGPTDAVKDIDGKVHREWVLESKEGVVSVYDWKEEQDPALHNAPIEWRIRAHTSRAAVFCQWHLMLALDM